MFQPPKRKSQLLSQTAKHPKLHGDGEASAITSKEDATLIRPLVRHRPSGKLRRILWRITVMLCSKSFQFCLCFDPAIPLLRIYSEEINVAVLKDLTTGMFGKALIMATEMRKNPNPKTGEWLSKLWYICTISH